jgi:hypothetical protein
MPAMQVRSSTKFIKLGYLLCLVMAIAIAAYLKSTGPVDDRYWGLLIVPAFFLIVLMMRHIKRRMVKLDIVGDRVRYESGFLSKMTRTEDVIKLQDVQVHQTLGQRKQPDCHEVDRPATSGGGSYFGVGKSAEAAPGCGTDGIAWESIGVPLNNFVRQGRCCSRL